MTDDESYPVDIDSYSNPAKNISVAISMIAIFHAITGVLTIPLVYIIFFPSSIVAPIGIILVDLSDIIILVIIQGAILATTIPIYIVLGWAIWTLQSWAWKVAVIINVVCLVFNIIGGVVLIAILNILLLLALNASDVHRGLDPTDA